MQQSLHLLPVGEGNDDLQKIKAVYGGLLSMHLLPVCEGKRDLQDREIMFRGLISMHLLPVSEDYSDKKERKHDVPQTKRATATKSLSGFLIKCGRPRWRRHVKASMMCHRLSVQQPPNPCQNHPPHVAGPGSAGT